jgi:hypothetical protein
MNLFIQIEMSKKEYFGSLKVSMDKLKNLVEL